MKYDITLKITPKMVRDAQGNEKRALIGHLGTHFDCMDKEFPLAYTECKGLVFDVSDVNDRDIDLNDIDIDKIKEGMFVMFYTGYINKVDYGTKEYYRDHPQLSHDLIDALLEAKVSMIGLDFAGIRRGPEHPPTDQRCANRGVFIIENMCNLDTLLDKEDILVHTYPMSYVGMSGLPCRIIAEA